MKNALPMKKNLFNPLVLWIVLLLLSGGFGLAQEKSLPMPAISAEPSRGLSTKGILLRPGTQKMQPLQPLQMEDWEAPSDQSAPRFVTFGKRGGTTPISPYAVGIIRYVKEIASGSGDGSDWNNASDNLQAMIDGASAGDQVWVAKGLYKPTPTTDRNIAFVMKDGVSIYGGFAGNEPSGYDLGLRDFDTNPTILSGDLQGNDGQQPVATDATTNTNTGDNSHTIVNASGVGAGTVIDGFTFTAGAADVPNPFPSPTARGAGIYMDGGELLVTNCRFSGNSASAIGGAGIYAIRGVLTVTHSTFSGNYGYNSVGIQGSRGNITSVMHCEFSGNSAAYVGAAMGLTGTNAVSYCNFTGNFANSSAGALHLDGPTTIDHSTFTGNYVAQQTSLDDAGGAVYVVDNPGSFLVMTACNFTDNRAVNGGALMAFAPVSISGCSFDGNSTKLSGGAVYLLNQLNSTPHSITNSTFTNNQAGDGVEFLGRGGGLYIQNAFAQINDCDFTGNRVLAEDRGQQEYYGGGGAVGIELARGGYSATIENCRFIDNTAINCNGGAIYNIADNSTTFSGSLFQGNTATYWGGAVCNDQAIVSISTSTFTENQALYGGGIFNWYSFSAVNQCDFVGNVANAGGGGMSIAYEQSNTVTNTIFRNNRASGTDGAGGALLIQGATTRITNTTIAGNSADYGGAVSVLLTGSNPEFINTIVYGNPTVNGAQFVFADGTPTATFSYTLLEEGDCYPEATCGPGMIYGQDPLFVSASDLHLQPGSPTINTGTNTGAPDSDIEGNPRALTLANPADMGAYEAQPCAITGLTAGNQTACDPATNLYTQQVTVTYAHQPASGTLNVNGQSFAITASPQTVTLIDLVSDGQAVNVTASFSAEPACSLTTNALFTAPDACDALNICAEINPLIIEINALLNNPGTPRKSKSKLIKAKDYLNSACDNFTAGEYDRGFNDLADAADELDKAMEKGANASAIRVATVDLARLIATETIADAQAYAGDPAIDQLLSKAAEALADGDAERADDKFDKAVKEYGKAWEYAAEAIQLAGNTGTGGEISMDLDPVLNAIDALLANNPNKKARKALQKAHGKVTDAQSKYDNGDIEDGYGKLEDAVGYLEDAADEGSDADPVITDLLSLGRDYAVAKITEAQTYAGTPEVDLQITKAQNYLSEGDAAAVQSKNEKAMDRYGKAWAEAQEGVLLGNGLGKTTGEPIVVIPTEYGLDQNYPNPFNPETTIRFALPQSGNVTLKIFNLSGQLVRTLVSSEFAAGQHQIVWNGRNDLGEKVASGMYLYRITAGSFVQTKKMMLMK